LNAPLARNAKYSSGQEIRDSRSSSGGGIVPSKERVARGDPPLPLLESCYRAVEAVGG